MSIFKNGASTPLNRTVPLAVAILSLSAPVTSSDFQLEEVVVTATKRAVSLSDIPFSINAQTEDQMRRSGAVDIESIARNVAGLQVQNLGPGQSQVAIRGISAGQIVRDQPGVKEQVGVYLDESAISMSLFTPDLDFYDTNRVEVLRGPQGTLFGAGSLSGTIRYITNQPIVDEFDASFEGTVRGGSESSTGEDLKGMVNLPLGDNAALRLVGYYKKMPGFIDAHQPDGSIKKNVNDGINRGVRAALRFEPTDNFSVTGRVVYQDVNVDGMNREDFYNVLANEFTTTRPAVEIGEREQFTQMQETFEDEFTLVDLTMEWDIGDFVITSATSYTEREILMRRDFTQLQAYFGGNFPIYGAAGDETLSEALYTLTTPLEDTTDVEMITQELRIASMGDGALNWVAGVFYSDIERDYLQNMFTPGISAGGGVPDQSGTFAGPDTLFINVNPFTLEQIAVFGELNYALNDQWTVTAGLRWYDYEEESALTKEGYYGGGPTKVSNPSANGVSPRLIVKYQVNDSMQINAQVAKGFRLGGSNEPLSQNLCSAEDRAIFDGGDSFEDEELTNYEIGTKMEILGGAGTLNISAFYSKIEGLQATIEVPSCSQRIIYNVPEASSKGIEFELTARPLENYEFAISGTYVDAKLDSTVVVPADQSILGGLESGNQLPTSPKLQLAASATYYFPWGKSGLEGFVSGTWQYSGERWTQFGDQVPGYGAVDLTGNQVGGPSSVGGFKINPKLDSYQLVNLRLGATAENWEVALFVNNVTDEVAQLGLDREANGAARFGYLVNRPRTLGLTARYNY